MYIISKMDAILSHTRESLKYVQGGMGEIVNSQKFRELIPNSPPIVDIYAFFKNIELYNDLAHLNISLAREGEEIIDHASLPGCRELQERLAPYRLFYLLSFPPSLAALFALGIHLHHPTIAKLYVHHPDERVWTSLFAPASMLICESPLALTKAIDAGIPPWKIAYLPHYPSSHFPPKDPHYLKKVAERHEKEMKKGAIIVGMVSRLEMGKNVEFALQVCERLVSEGYPLIFILKGQMPSMQNEYHYWLHKLVTAYLQYDWFFWDREESAFPQVLGEYENYDLILHLSGAEAGSNLVVEMLSLGKPVVLLESSTNPSLFHGMASFVKAPTRIEHFDLPFNQPDPEELYLKVKECMEKRHREELGHVASKEAERRFSREDAAKRVPLIIEAAQAYHFNSSEKEKWKKEIEALAV